MSKVRLGGKREAQRQKKNGMKEEKEEKAKNNKEERRDGANVVGRNWKIGKGVRSRIVRP